MNARERLIENAVKIQHLAYEIEVSARDLTTNLTRDEQMECIEVISDCGSSIGNIMWDFDDVMNELVPTFGFANMFEFGQAVEAMCAESQAQDCAQK